MAFRTFTAIILLSLMLSISAWANAESNSEPFYPTWKLLNAQEKQQFIAGYLHGWKDAAKVTDIVIAYIKDNPQKAVEGLESTRSLYSVEKFRPAEISREIDGYFQSGENRDASLSKALSFAKSRLQ